MFKTIFSNTSVGGSVSARKLGKPGLFDLVKSAIPSKSEQQEVREWKEANFINILKGMRGIVLAKALGHSHILGTLQVSKITPLVPDSLLTELLEQFSNEYVPGIDFPYWLQLKGFKSSYLNYGLGSTRVVTTVGVGFVVDAFQNSVELENMKYHGLGTGGTAEAAGDTALVTELTTEYNPNSTRATGSTTEGASANIYRTIGTNTVDASAAVTEHGVFSQAATGGGVLFDRSLFSVINLANGDSLQTTYDATFSAGG